MYRKRGEKEYENFNEQTYEKSYLQKYENFNK